MTPARERGMALLIVLLLVAAMSVLVIAMLDDIRFGIRRAGNSEAIAQARWYALGAEALAGERLRQAHAEGVDAFAPGGSARQAMAFPLEHGGIRARVDDATACFNLNSVVEGMPEAWRRRELGVRQYVALLRALDFPEHQAQAMADALVDWIDSDQVRSPQGAEDAAYVGGDSGYRTGGALLADASELRAIAHHPQAAYARIRPLVCAQPTAAPSPVNINALRREHAPLLAMLTLGALAADDAGAVLAARPAGGWSDTLAFWGDPRLRAAPVPNQVYDQVALRSRYVELVAEVDYAGAQVALHSLLDLGAPERVRLVGRRWTHEE